MKKFDLFLVLLSFCNVFSQAAGDILFVGFNTDGDKDFIVVAMTDLPANTTIYFTDNEPNATGTGNSGSEGTLQWNTGTSIITTGTVVVFTDVDNVSNSNFGASLGTLTYQDAGFNISTNGDSVYATYGNPSENEVTTWISGIQNNNDGLEANFSATSLSTATNFVVIDNTASKDGGEYTGAKSGKTAPEYAALIVDESNWTTSTTDGESFLPFNTTAFTMATLSSENINAEEVKISVIHGRIISNKGSVLKVLTVLGQEIKNENLSSGIYLVIVENLNKKIMIKLAI